MESGLFHWANTYYFENSSTEATKMKSLVNNQQDNILILHKFNCSEDEKTCIFPYLKETGQANKTCLTDRGKGRKNPQCIIELKRGKLVNLIETQLNM